MEEEQKSAETNRPEEPQQSTPIIVGVGASAGGLKALETFFSEVHPGNNIAYVVLQHLMREHESMLVDLLRKKTDIPVQEITDGIQIDANNVYVCPPHKEINIYNGTIQLFEPDNANTALHPIDSFLRSLAREAGRKAACVILSGTGTDGTLGLKEINAHNGLCIAQSSDTAQYDGMPMSAIETGFVDYILAPQDMPEAIRSYFKNYTVSRAVSRPEGPWLNKIFSLLKEKTQHDFSHYKINTILRRITRRMNLNEIKEQEEYVQLLKQNPGELEALFSELLIGVTSFFREHEAFETLKKHVLPDMLANRDGNETVRVWVPGCSTGEEVYSLGIVFKEVLERRGLHIPIQIFATDIDSAAIERARHGRYPDSIEADVSMDRLKRYFVKQDDFYIIKREIRDLIVFSIHDVLKDPPFTSLELVCCRNLLIYLNTDAQKKLIPLFHYCLKKDGILMLGTSETIGQYSDIFKNVDKETKLFKKKGTAMERYDVHFPISPPKTYRELASYRVQQPRKTQRDLETRLRDLIISEVAPVTVLVDENDTIKYITGKTGKYLMPAEGFPNQNIISMAREGLQVELSTALSRVKKEKTSVTRKHIRVKTNGEEQYIDLTVKPVSADEYTEGGILVVFFEREKPAEIEQEQAESSPQKRELKSRISELEQELQETRESHQVTVEELETSNEEIKSMNEELQSSNEELQSTNEELESSKEELQSLNEELTTVNNELQEKVDELSDANDDMNNLLNSTNIAALFLDSNLRIRRYTPAIEELINFIESDVGRPFHHVSHNLVYDRLKNDIEEVMETLQSKEKEIQSEEGGWYKMRILPYRTTENIIDGAVITFFEITKQKQIQGQLQFSLDFSENILDTVREPLLVLDGNLNVIKANHAFYSIFKAKEKDTVGNRIYELGNRQWDNNELRRLLENIIPENNAFENFEIEHTFPQIGTRKMLLNARKLTQEHQGMERIFLAIEDVTDQQG
jgi:two-component system CheB/CheR fusion protein